MAADMRRSNRQTRAARRHSLHRKVSRPHGVLSLGVKRTTVLPTEALIC